MLDQDLIEGAIVIRKEFLLLTKKLSKYESDLKGLSEYFYKFAKEMDDYKTNVKKTESVESIKKYILDKISELELESNKITNKIKPVNKKIEKLRKDETELYNTIKRRYPNLSDTEIKSEIQSHLSE